MYVSKVFSIALNVLYNSVSDILYGEIMSGSGDNVFIFSPQGVATVAVVVGVAVSAVWLAGCITYCLWRHYWRREITGTAATTDVSFLSSPIDITLSRPMRDAEFSYSINSLAVEPAFHHTSMESILSADSQKTGNDNKT